MITSYSRGHKIYFKNKEWHYADTDEICNYDRPCKKCNSYPTKEGYDACLGYIVGAKSACCGHGVEKEYRV